jgi:Acyclic terpene utilisation family protein AtuA
MSKTIKYLSLCGMLGYGYPLESLKTALQEDLAFIGVDAGSTDPGPYYLGSGNAFVKDIQVKRDLEPALIAAVERNIPLIVGTAGGSGARPHVDHFLEILLELAHKNNLHFKLAVIYSDIDKKLVSEALNEGRISPCGPALELTEDRIKKLVNPVAQAGTDPLIEALRQGADVVISGRCCDTAIFAAYPIMRGFDPGLALHCAKIAECGALCARPVGANDSLICTLAQDHFIVEPANPERKCSPDSVAAHSLYEQPDPNCFYEPEGMIDMNESSFEQITSHAVKVTGTVLRPGITNTLKLEGVELKGYRAVTIGGSCDPTLISNISKLEAGVRQVVASTLTGIIAETEYQLFFRRYGMDAVTFNSASDKSLPTEIGLLIEAIAPTQELADNIISLSRSTALHQSFPGRKATAGNLAFPFSPSDLSGGAVYEFSLYHLLETCGNTLYFNIETSEI